MEKKIPVVVIRRVDETDKILKALKACGINCAEIAFRTACAVGNHVNKPQQILTAVAKAHAAAGPAFVIGGGTAHVESHHTLVLIPDIHHSVQLFIRGDDGVNGKQFLPVLFQMIQSVFHGDPAAIFCDERVCLPLVDNAGSLPFFRFGVFDITEQKDQCFFLAGGKFCNKLVTGDGRPSAGNGIETVPARHRGGRIESVEFSEEGVAVGIKTAGFFVDGIKGKMVAPFAIFRLVIKDGRFNFHLTRRVIALEIRIVVHGIPKTPFGCGKNFQRFFFARSVCQRQLLDFAPIAPRHKAEKIRANAVLLCGKEGIPQSVSTFVAVKFRFCGKKGGRKYRFSVRDIKTSSAVVCRYIVITVARDPPEFRILVKIIPSSRIGNQPEKIFVAEVIDPR